MRWPWEMERSLADLAGKNTPPAPLSSGPTARANLTSGHDAAQRTRLLRRRCHDPVRRSWSQRREIARRFSMPARSAFDPETLVAHGPRARRGVGRVRGRRAGCAPSRRSPASAAPSPCASWRPCAPGSATRSACATSPCTSSRVADHPRYGMLAAVKPTGAARGRRTNRSARREASATRGCAHATSLPDRLSCPVSAASPSFACEGDTPRHVQRGRRRCKARSRTGKGEHDAQGPFDYVYLELGEARLRRRAAGHAGR